ncbi:MAG TPA: pyridoxal phosphate-dependent aminotransferase [Anaeromyxobacteraceae bacterium]|nr:pyridoxal phosphate-dependent aminotransferase [Anaeromyxobacteraceae bacterium]
MRTQDLRGSTFDARLEQARAEGTPLIDLTETDPTRCGLTWGADELQPLAGHLRSSGSEASSEGLREARDAVASYLAGRGVAVQPDRVLITASKTEVYAPLVSALCGPGDEVLVPAPGLALALRGDGGGVRRVNYALRYDGAWRLDRESLTAGVTSRTRAIVTASPADPSGAVLSREELAFLEELCDRRGIALIGDERYADTAFDSSPSVARSDRCLAFHVSDVASVCGVPQLGVAWLAAAGAERLVGPALARLAATPDVASPPKQAAIPALLAGRGGFLAMLRARLAQNRAALATAALREAPWTVLNSGGGWSAVLEIGDSEDEAALCLALIDDGVAVQPGFRCGFDRNGYLVVSLLPRPEVFSDGLDRLEGRLRRPLQR